MAQDNGGTGKKTENLRKIRPLLPSRNGKSSKIFNFPEYPLKKVEKDFRLC